MKIDYISSDEGDALYVDGVLYDSAPKLYIYDLLVLLQLKGIAETNQINCEIEKQKFDFPTTLMELKKKIK